MANEALKEARRHYVAAKEAGDQKGMLEAAQMFRAAKAEEPSKLGGVLRQGAQGLTLGFADELEAGARSLGDETYSGARDRIRAENDAFANENPGTALTAQIVGGLMTGGAGALRSGGAALARTALRRPVGRMGELMGTGAIEGAIAGAGAAEEMTDIPMSSLGGAVGGAMLGAGMRGAENVLGGRMARQQAAGMDRALGGRSPAQAVADVTAMGPDARLMDTSRQASALAGSAHRAMPENASKYEDFLINRQEQSPFRIENALRRETGANLTKEQTKDAVQAFRSKEAEALFGPLAGQPMRPSQSSLLAVQQTPAGRRASAYALRRLNMQRIAQGQQPAELQDVAGQFDYWHLVQQELRSQAEAAGRSNSAQSRGFGGDVGKLRTSIVEDMQSQPWGERFRVAQDAYRERSQVLGAIENAADFRRIDRDRLTTMVSDMSQHERQAMANAVISDLVEKAMAGPTSAGLARDIIKSQGMRQRLGDLLGSDTADRLVKELQNEETLRKAYNESIAVGSRTAGREVEDAIFSGFDPTEAAGEVATGGIMSMVGNTARNMAGRGRVMHEGAARNVLDAMMMPPGAGLQDALTQMAQGRQYSLTPALLGGLQMPAQQLNIWTGQ